MDSQTILLWGAFTAFVGVLLAVDLLLVSRNERVMSVRSALLWSALWISMALVFGAGVFVVLGSDKGIEYLTGYVIEKSLGVDNLFVFLIIFGFFGVPKELQPKALTWGIMMALVMRFFFIIVGAALLETFHWIVFIFGGVLILTAIRLAKEGDTEVHPDKNILIKGLRKIMPVQNEFDHTHFFSVKNGVRYATPFLVTILVLASTDLVFQNLLDMTRLGHGTLQIRRDWVPVDDIIGGAMSRLRRYFPGREIEYQSGVSALLLYVQGALVEQALYNILENAAKYSIAGEPIRIRVKQQDGKCLINVEDSGPGIPESLHEKIFDMFYAVATGDQKSQNTGMGLAICRGMINAHGGRVTARAADNGRGTCFTIELPIDEPNAMEAS